MSQELTPTAAGHAPKPLLPPTQRFKEFRNIIDNGLWSQNMVFTQMLALCPLLAVTGTATNGLGMGLASTAVLVFANILVSVIRNWVSPSVRIPVFIVVIASLVTLVDMMVNAWLHDLYKILGLFIALIVCNCGILGRAEAFASRRPVSDAALDGLAMGAGFTIALVALGATREIIGSGTLFSGAALLLGEPFRFLELTLISDYKGFLLMILPPGGFLALGFLMALQRAVSRRRAQQRSSTQARASTA